MCGRFVGTFDGARLIAELGGILPLHDVEAVAFRSFNVAPTTMVPVLVASHGAVVLEPMQWGLVPAWAKDASRSASMINARLETAAEKPSFRGLVSGNRCLVPMDGFYEWDRAGPGPSVPYFVSRSDGRLLLVAGLWTRSAAIGGGPSVAMLTEESGGVLSRIHHRAPVVPDDAAASRWLMEGTSSLSDLSHAARATLRMHRVGSRVNSVRNNDPSLLEEDDGTGSPTQPTLF